MGMFPEASAAASCLQLAREGGLSTLLLTCSPIFLHLFHSFSFATTIKNRSSERGDEKKRRETRVLEKEKDERVDGTGKIQKKGKYINIKWVVRARE